MHYLETAKAARLPHELSATEPECSVKRGLGGNYELKIRGKLPHGWVVNLTSGIAAAGISIVKGSARKLSPSFWDAGFEVRPAAFGIDPAAVDYLRLCGRGAHRSSSAVITLDRFTFLEPGGSRSALGVEVQGEDQTGFLAGLLDRFSFFSLFPEEMIIETTAGKIHDRFWLSGPGGIAPSEDIAVVLRRKLEGMLGS